MYIVSLNYSRELTEVDKYLAAHVAYLEKYYALGKFIASGRKVPRTGGIILVNAADKNELDSILREDPFYKAQLTDVTVTEFTPTMTTAGLEALTTY
jgi:uncharacterized protein YciI